MGFPQPKKLKTMLPLLFFGQNNSRGELGCLSLILWVPWLFSPSPGERGFCSWWAQLSTGGAGSLHSTAGWSIFLAPGL